MNPIRTDYENTLNLMIELSETLAFYRTISGQAAASAYCAIKAIEDGTAHYAVKLLSMLRNLALMEEETAEILLEKANDRLESYRQSLRNGTGSRGGEE